MRNAIAYVLVTAVGLATAGAVRAQSPTGGAAFEVASVKPNKSADLNWGFGMPADRFQATNVTLQELVATAYGEPGPPPHVLPDDQISGGPAWMNTDRFDIIAKAGSDVPPGPGGKKFEMLRTLLAERFRLAVHHETREAPTYALVLARGDGKLGPQLHQSGVDCDAFMAARARGNAPPPTPSGERPPCTLQAGLNGTLRAAGQTMSSLANAFARLTDRVVVDRTGLTGGFDFDLQFNPEGLRGLFRPGIDQPQSNDAPPIFTAVQEQLGLKLESTTGSVDVVVIDHAERPTEN